MKFPPDYKKLVFTYAGKIDHFQKRSYLSPYADARGLQAGSLEFDKKAVAVMHELLSFTIEKRLVTDHLTHFRRELVMPQKLMRLLLKHFGIFYVSERGQRFGLIRPLLIQKCLLVLWREKVPSLIGHRGKKKKIPSFDDLRDAEDKDLLASESEEECVSLKLEDEETMGGLELDDASDADDSGMEAAFYIFNNQMVEKNVVSWTAIISGCASAQNSEMALHLFRAMQAEGIKRSRVPLLAILPVCTAEFAKEIHGYAFRHVFESDSCFSLALVHSYCKTGDGVACHFAKIIFQRARDKDVIRPSSMIGSYSSTGDVAEALKLYGLVQLEGIRTNTITPLAMVSSCTASSSPSHGQGVHTVVLKSGFSTDVFIGNSLVHGWEEWFPPGCSPHLQRCTSGNVCRGVC
ncbi:Pentatricopeptide repeat [Dillenia turbinata]|uniref:Pentatricopeptide repeat n=1 Tax=Dillenia turbinata TaxID=194707 RepID=A0AAN8VWF6_9MAGN